MRRLALSALTAAAVSGCANYDALRATAPNASQYELCRAGWLHNDATVREIAVSELGRRGQDCSQWATALAQERAANSQQALNTLLLMRALQPPAPAPLPMPAQPVTCTTNTYGSTARTTCQ